jgi:hypothetical protein
VGPTFKSRTTERQFIVLLLDTSPVGFRIIMTKVSPVVSIPIATIKMQLPEPEREPAKAGKRENRSC